jgi:AcrR family transcriptional regulator
MQKSGMKKRTVKKRADASATRLPEATRAALVEAAWAEFEEVGYDATNTNRIAQRAGYAPQTFYRHFPDKAAIFLAVYSRWVAEEEALMDGVRHARAAAEAAIAHHRRSHRFRRALRLLSLSDDRVRAARAESRLQQIARLRARLPHLAAIDAAELAARLLTVERLTDACAEGELADLGVPDAEARRALERLLKAAFGKGGPS